MDSIMNYAIDGYKDIKAGTKIGIFGNPIQHTLSPVIHDTLSARLGIDERYIPFLVEGKLKECVEMAYHEGILGLNITVPHKQAVMDALVDIDDAAKAIGAVNTLVRCKNGYKGYNTDMPGLARAMSAEGIELEGRQVIMLGAGGAARAVAYMCVNYGAKKVYIVNRTFENAEKIAEDMNCVFNTNIVFPVASKDYRSIPKDRYLFIQCTSVGLHEKDGLPLVCDEEFYDMAWCGVDLIYNPAETPFIKLMKRLGRQTMNGLKMLLYQGVLAYELWNEIKVSEELCNEVYCALCETVYGTGMNADKKNVKKNAKNNIVLIGYMGSGKSSVGRYISKTYGYDFLDTDAYIEDRAGMPIKEIFAVKGEEYFRKLETEMLNELKENLSNTVVSTGGGMPLRKENSEILKQIGNVFFLSAEADTIYKRVKDNNERPLLNCDNPYKKICDMLEIRNPIYQEATDNTVVTDNRTKEEIAEEIRTKSLI